MAVMEAIETVYLEDDCATIKFTGISWAYQHLQMQISGRSTVVGDGYRIIYMRFGGDWGDDSVDSATNYRRIYFRIYAGGAGAYTYSSASYLSPARILEDGYDTGNVYSPSIIDIFDYQNASKRSTIHFTSHGASEDSSGANGEIAMGGGLWNADSGIKTIEITQQDNDFTRGTMVALYGWKNS